MPFLATGYAATASEDWRRPLPLDGAAPAPVLLLDGPESAAPCPERIGRLIGRLRGAYRDVPIIVVSSDADETAARRAAEAGCPRFHAPTPPIAILDAAGALGRRLGSDPHQRPRP